MMLDPAEHHQLEPQRAGLLPRRHARCELDRVTTRYVALIGHCGVPDHQRIVELLAERRSRLPALRSAPHDARRHGGGGADLAELATSDPHRFAIDTRTGARVLVGAALLPSSDNWRGSKGRSWSSRTPWSGAVPGELWRRRARGDTAGRERTTEEPGAVQYVYDACSSQRRRRPRSCRSVTRSSAMAGFTAATYFRGLDLVNCPRT